MRVAVLAWVLVLACAAASAQTLYKCVHGGKTVYQDSKCDESAMQSAVKAPAPVARGDAGDAKPAADKADQAAPATSDLDSAIDVVAGYQACSEGIFEWEGAHRSAYEEWRLRNGAVISRVENEPEAQRRRLQKLESFRGGPSRTCANVIAVINPGRADFMKDVRPTLAKPGAR
jgi:hypothetical protein